MLLFRRVSDSLNALGMTLAGYAAIGLFVFIGVGFLLAAGVMALADAVGAIAAALIVGASFLVVAALGWIVLSIRARERKRKRREAAASTAMMASSLSLANTGLRLAGRVRGRAWLAPAAAVALAAWFFTREGD